MKHSDRWAWSSKDGKKQLLKESFQLPSVEWIWEGDWYIDHGIDVDNEVIENEYQVFNNSIKTCPVLYM